MKQGAVSFTFLVLAFAVRAALAGDAAQPPAPARPAWCQADWVCEPADRARALALELVRLRKHEAELEAAIADDRAQGIRRFGFCAGPSFSFLGEATRQEPDGSYRWEWHAGAGVSLLWGMRFGGRGAPAAP